MYHDNRNNCDCRLSKRQIRSEMLKYATVSILLSSFQLQTVSKRNFSGFFPQRQRRMNPEPREETIPARETAAAASSGAAHEKFRRPAHCHVLYVVSQ